MQGKGSIHMAKMDGEQVGWCDVQVDEREVGHVGGHNPDDDRVGGEPAGLARRHGRRQLSTQGRRRQTEALTHAKRRLGLTQFIPLSTHFTISKCLVSLYSCPEKVWGARTWVYLCNDVGKFVR
jgi:hypothetical protein